MSDTPVVHLAWATRYEVPADEAWLTPEEALVHAALRMPHRVADWRLGRWVAKGAVAAALDQVASARDTIEVLAAPGGAPVARLLGPSSEVPTVSVSLSHSGGTGFAAAAPGAVRLGCDLETIEPRSDAFVSDYFTTDEEVWIRAGGSLRHTRANLLWSAKESALKALGEGLRMDTRSVEVEALEAPGLDLDTWRALAVATPGGATFPGLWRVRGGRAWTVVAERPFVLAPD
jgi:4'-phosphopantetheinyl transferase